ncbi:MAG: hypothetical protein GEV28_01350 [Actinophytocola sp.]|uniref:hypothetical protein n=1 Tax=Actinophytocola sp. TaxID=1872138 RepID=UPI0013249FC5|nr:hypothetical protein [Actinophytocola sp.]MPZ79106.1 hypothetical protein [Actinophytocola sp.]
MRIASDAPPTIRGAGLLVGLQGLTGIGFAIALLVRALGGGSTEGNNVFGEAGYFTVLGGGVVAVGVALVLGKHWARSPSVVVELLLLGVAWYAAGPSGRPGIGVPVGVLCVVVLYLLFTARSREWSLGLDDEYGGEGAGKTGQ